ncbi:MAG: exo-alpha-sialidase, partial [Cyclobacteriaceae bacterium]
YRVDSQGYFVFKYSDDHGKTWSENRYTIPVREFEIDRNNAYGGDIRFFWNVGRAFQHHRKGYVPLHKVGGFGKGFFTSNEGVLLMSPNILHEDNPNKIKWQTLPDGDIGLRTPPGGGPISAEQNFSVLSDGSFYVVYRSVDGHPVNSYSRDEGHTWEPPKYQTYANGKLMKHPRAANFAWKCSNGKYLYWFHNHGGRSYDDRNPVWISGGMEVDGADGKIIRWSQPEILLYDPDPYIRMSYPDLVEEDGEYYFTETQKSIARIHQADKNLLEGLWGQFEKQQQVTPGAVLSWVRGQDNGSDMVKMPALPDFVARDANRADHGTKNLNTGFTIDMKVNLGNWENGKIMLDSRLENGQGLVVSTTERGTLELQMNDGRTIAVWDSDSVSEEGKTHHVTIIVDGGPGIISFVVDGQVCDGGTYRQFGWGRFSPHFRHANGAEKLMIGKDIIELKIYDRPLRVSESIGNFLSE